MLEVIKTISYILGLARARLSEVAEKLDFALAFGWRSGLPLR
jgi:hypothetical protein